MTPTPGGNGSGKASLAVGTGILLSRLSGFVRLRFFSFYLGVGPQADAFNLALRIPNMLQNLLGEGVLSASFIPVYARLRAGGQDREAAEVAGAVLGLAALAASLIVLLGVLAAPVLVELLAPGFDTGTKVLTVRILRILFPGAGLMVVSAWCLGVLNSHGRFLLSYVSPVIWNLAMIVVMVAIGAQSTRDDLVIAVAWASVLGSALQVGIQWPAVRSALGSVLPSFGRENANVRTVLRNFLPVVVGRGITQIAGFLDSIIASFLVEGSVSIISYAQLIYMLPVSLFGMSVSAAELPAMSGEASDDEAGAERIRMRLRVGLARIFYFVVPSAVAFIVLGDHIARVVLQGGAFGGGEVQWQWMALAGAGVGILAATRGRLYASALYALQDARSPQRYAVTRVTLSLVLGGGAVYALSRTTVDPRLGVACLMLASGLAAWVEYWLLERAVRRRVGSTAIQGTAQIRVVAAAAAAALCAWASAAGLGASTSPRIVSSVAVLLLYACTYGLVSWGLHVPEARSIVGRIIRRR